MIFVRPFKVHLSIGIQPSSLVAHWLSVLGDHGSNLGGREKNFLLLFRVVISFNLRKEIPYLSLQGTNFLTCVLVLCFTHHGSPLMSYPLHMIHSEKNVNENQNSTIWKMVPRQDLNHQPSYPQVDALSTEFRCHPSLNYNLHRKNWKASFYSSTWIPNSKES